MARDSNESARGIINHSNDFLLCMATVPSRAIPCSDCAETTPQDYPEWSGFGRRREREWGYAGVVDDHKKLFERRRWEVLAQTLSEERLGGGMTRATYGYRVDLRHFA
jgi:hypothetical protein